jgi:predicted nucleic acid-binding protein
VKGYFFDTSVLIAGIVELSPVGAPAQKLMGAVAEGQFERVATAWHCCLEFYAVTTRLPVELRVSPSDAALLVRDELLGRFEVSSLPPEARLDFLGRAEADRVAGGRVYDAHIAEVARRAGATTVVTENRRHFASLLRDGIRVLTAAELCEQLGM